MTNWPNSIQCLGLDDIMSLGIKSSAFLRVEHPFSRKFKVSQKREFELRGPIANFEYVWEKVEPIHPLSDKVFERLGL